MCLWDIRASVWVWGCWCRETEAPWEVALPWLSGNGDSFHTPTAAELKELQNYFAENPEQLAEQAKDGGLPLHEAVSFQRGEHVTAMVSTLLEACPDAAHHQDVYGMLPLHWAALSQAGPQAVAVVNALLVVYPAAAQIQEDEGRLPLHCATISRRTGEESVAVIHSLLRAFPRATRMREENGRLPLHMAAASQRGVHGLVVITALLAAYPRAASKGDVEGLLPVDIAREFNSSEPDIVSELQRAPDSRPRRMNPSEVDGRMMQRGNEAYALAVEVNHPDGSSSQLDSESGQ